MHLIDDVNTSILVLAIAMAKLSPESKNEGVMYHAFCCASASSEGYIHTGKWNSVWECSQVHLIYTSAHVASAGNRHSFRSCKSPEELNETHLYVNA